MEELETKKKEKVIEIYPTKVGRRILCFLADIFSCLILSIVFFELVVFQIARPIINYDNLLFESDNNQRAIYNLFYEREYLYFDGNEDNRYRLSLSLEYTSDRFIEFYCADTDKNLAEFDVFYKYFVADKEENKEENLNKLNELYLQYGTEYFDQNSNTILGTYALKDQYVDQFEHNFIPGDEMSEEAKRYYEDFSQNFFLNVYNQLFADVEKNNLVSLDGERSYFALNDRNKEITETLNNAYVTCSYISFLVSCVILFLVIPLITEKRQTLSEKILKIERVTRKNISYIKKPLVLNIFLLKLIDSMCLLFLVPSLRVGFNYIFALPILYLPSLVSLVVILVNLGLTMFTKLNTSLKEITTDSIMCNQSSIDEYYKEFAEF